MDRKARLQELLNKQKQKEYAQEKKKAYETVLEEVNELFPISDGNVEILSEEESQAIVNELFEVFPFYENGINWDLMSHKTFYSNSSDYESSLGELINRKHKLENEISYIIDLNFQHVIETKLTNILYRIEEIRTWDRYIYCPQFKLVIEFPSNFIAVGWKE